MVIITFNELYFEDTPEMQRRLERGRSFQPPAPTPTPTPIRMPFRLPWHPPRVDVDANANEIKSDRSLIARSKEASPALLPDSIRSPETKEQREIVKKCICLRDVCLVFCKYCGYHNKGRISKSCECHPNVMFLMDIHQCPRCKGYGLAEFPVPR